MKQALWYFKPNNNVSVQIQKAYINCLFLCDSRWCKYQLTRMKKCVTVTFGSISVQDDLVLPNELGNLASMIVFWFVCRCSVCAGDLFHSVLTVDREAAVCCLENKLLLVRSTSENIGSTRMYCPLWFECGSILLQWVYMQTYDGRADWFWKKNIIGLLH